MNQLKGAQQKFIESKENVKKLSKRDQGEVFNCLIHVGESSVH